ncbi:NifU family protein [Brevibacillus sp. SYSU BS000544]|uniref:NifU family protein n=1 Tax=Brevibacillus sp. SYSU BS000544 TaxID=3416443 RepID=UPI003CE58FD6
MEKDFTYSPLDNNDVNIYEDKNAKFVPPIGGCSVSEVNKEHSERKKAESNVNIEEKVIDCLEKIRPYLQKDGGDVEYVGIEKNWVQIKMLGNCNGCNSVGFSLVEIEEYLVEEITGIKGVSWV